MEEKSRNLRLDVRDASVYCDAPVYMTNRNGFGYRLDPRAIVRGLLDLGGTIASAVRRAGQQAAHAGRPPKLREFHLRRAMEYGRTMSSSSIFEIASAIGVPPHTLLLRRYLDEDCVEHPALATLYRYAFLEVVVGVFQPEQVDEQLRDQAAAMLLPSTIEKLRWREPDLFEMALENLADRRREYDPAIDGPPPLPDVADRRREDTERLRNVLRQSPLVRRRLRASIHALSLRLTRAATDLDLYEFDTIDNQLHSLLDREGTCRQSFASIRNSLWYECCMKTFYRLSESDRADISSNYFRTTQQLALRSADIMNSQSIERAVLDFDYVNFAHLVTYESLAGMLTCLMDTGRRE